MNPKEFLLIAKNICKSNISGIGEKIDILKNINLTINQQQKVAITGASGSGKTTLLSLFSGLDKPDSGSISILSEEITTLSENDMTRFRAENMSIIFQQFYLMKHLSALENVALPLDILKNKDSMDKAKIALSQVGLEHRLHHLPSEISGGEMQRIAIARAIVTQPKILFADEPTGNLDNKNADIISQLLFELVEKNKMTLVLVTHNPELANICDQTFRLVNGEVH